MNLARLLSDTLGPRRSKKPDVCLRISNVTRQVEVADRVDIADSSSKRRKGLLGRERLSEGEGLWIVPCEAIHTFGMQFPIDLVYLDSAMLVKKIKYDVPPGRLSACLSAHSVLEIAAGTMRGTGTKVGDRLESSLCDTSEGVAGGSCDASEFLG